MTYCTAMRLDDGLVFLSDTRTNAGVDNVSTYRKLFVFHPRPDSTVVVQSAGNLGTTQEVLDRLRRDLDDPDATESLRTADHLFEAALHLGRFNVAVADSHRSTLGGDGASTFIVGGQIGDQPPTIYLVYPEGNDISASEDSPFLARLEAVWARNLARALDELPEVEPDDIVRT